MSHGALGPQFSLYHGTHVPGLTVIDGTQGDRNSPAWARGKNFSTNNPVLALDYAHESARSHGGSPVVYEVQHDEGDIQPDQHGYSDVHGEFEDMDEAMDHVYSGGYAQFEHSSPLRTVREVPRDEIRKIQHRTGWGPIAVD